MHVRLQKFLADQGVCSRRKAEDLIREGRVRVNNAVVTELGTKVDPEQDVVALNKRPLNRPQQLVYIALHKPVGVLTSCAQENEVTVRHLVQVPWRVVPAGRLDKDSSGLVLLTNDGAVVHRLTHPRFAHEKEYVVDVARLVTDAELAALARGIALDDGPTQPCAVHRIAARRFRMILREGRNRQIRRMCAALHLDVSGLRRTRIATLTLRDLPPAHWRHLTRAERDQLLAAVQAAAVMPAAALAAAPRRRRQPAPHHTRRPARLPT
jgi:23S rRNA pseudouridine2605 synthase/23S rRNA pseudouridine2604 synthase